MRELSLFSGVGGGCLGSFILGHKIVGYVEYENYCQKILEQRISDGILSKAPIFGDIKRFLSEGYAESYTGMVDIITAGFPCQPFSVAGKKKGEADERNMWPWTARVIRAIRPRYAFLENVPGLLNSGYFEKILGSLAQIGYDAEWVCLGADEVGANHRRKRLWILAYARCESAGGENKPEWASGKSSGCREEVPNADPERFPVRGQARGQAGAERDSEAHADAERCGGSWWAAEPNVGRVAHGVPKRVDRLKALGNAQVPIQMAYAFSILSQGIIK